MVAVADIRREQPTAPAPRLTKLRSYLVYRVLLALALLGLFAIDDGPAVLGAHDPGSFTLIAQTYLALTLLSLALSYVASATKPSQSYIAILTDVTAIVTMMHASGGVQSGLGTLLAVAIALASLSMAGRTALLFAALATLGVMAEQIYAQLSGCFAATAYTHAGLLGTSFFALALLAHQLSWRASVSEKLADQRQFDLANLAEMNDYVIQHMQTGVIVVDQDEIVRLVNEAAWYLLGMPENLNRCPIRSSSGALAEQLRAWRENEGDPRPSFRATSAGRDLQANFTPLGDRGLQGTLIFLEDTAAVIERAQQLKLASLGQLTASIAHEIRNPLGAISHAAQLLNESPEVAGSDRRMTEIIQQNAERLNHVVENVLSLSRRERHAVTPLILAPWLAQELDELRTTFSIDESQVRLDVDPGGTTVYTDAGQLRQITATLFDNAVRHFNGDQRNLRINVRAGITRESGGPFIDFMDNGPGIASSNIDKLFDPFFTTCNDGTGLGLFVARELSETNRARLEYLPLPSGGSCFRLSFPDPRAREHR